MLRRDEIETKIENEAFSALKAKQIPVEMFFDTDIVTMIYRETENIKKEAFEALALLPGPAYKITELVEGKVNSDQRWYRMKV